MMSSDFEIELQQLLNKHGIDNFTNIPDFILASYLVKILDNIRVAMKLTKQWEGEEKV